MTMDMYKDKLRDKNKENERFVFEEAYSPMDYKLIDKEMNQEYILRIREGAKIDPFFYAEEIISQDKNNFIKYRPAFGHYVVRDIPEGEEYVIPKKEVCDKVCKRLNELYDDKEVEND